MTGFSALILAGSRGEIDPVAAYAGVSQKGLIELAGQTLLERVTLALRAAGAGRIGVSASDAGVVAEAHRLGLEIIPTAEGPSQSVRLGAEHLGTPLLITTVDHALLQGEWVSRFLADAPGEADISILLARRDAVEAAAPATRRTYLRFADGDWSGCNLFWFSGPKALQAIDLWRRVEADRKRPWRIAWTLGPSTLLAYLLRQLTLDGAVRRLGQLAGIRAAAVATPFGLAAIDVDKPADLDLVRRLAS